ncbi:putative lipid II flippase FtsW [Corynebacterium diphtheriae]
MSTNTSNRGSRVRDRIASFLGEMMRRPLTDYYIVMFVIALLVLTGVLMVVTSSMATSVSETGSAWTYATKQILLIVIGFIAMIGVMQMPPRKVRKYAVWLMRISILLLIVVLIPGIGTGKEQVGSQSWIPLGPVNIQPSEIARVALAIWGASFLTRKPKVYFRFYGIDFDRRAMFAVIAGFTCALVMAEGDLGMTAMLGFLTLIMLVFAGLPRGLIVAALTISGVAFVLAVTMHGYRGHRITVFIDALFGRFDDIDGVAYQSYQGILSLADGSFTGLGIGQSRAKWFYLPEAKNDFIFAIVGEELGFVGAAIIIGLFTALLLIALRIALRIKDSFLSLAVATLAAGISLQAFTNMAYVIGLLPVTGIQLPLISAGGSSAVITLAALGLIANCARYEPEAISAMQSYGRPALDRVLFLREPDVSDIRTRRSTRRSSQGTRQSGAPKRQPPKIERNERVSYRQSSTGTWGSSDRDRTGSVDKQRGAQRQPRRRNYPQDNKRRRR